MIYGRDEAALYPVVDLYDSGMMGLYINAAKDEYERGIKQQEDFISKYGDFISPFQKDVENWDRLTMDPVIQTYNFLEKNGIDPLRSQEGRAAMASVMRQIPREKLSQLRQSAATGQQYLANRAKLQAEGKYNPEFEQFLLGDRQFGNYDTLSQGMWDRTSPTEYKGLRTLTDPWFQHRTLKFKGQKGGYDYYGYDEGDMRETANTQIKAFLASDYGRYFYDRAKRVAQGTATPGESQASIEKRAQDILMNDIVSANTDYLMNDRRVNQFALENLQHQHALARQRQAQAARQKAQEKKQKGQFNYHQSLFIRGALALIPNAIGKYLNKGADEAADYASKHGKEAFNTWKQNNANLKKSNYSEYKRKFLQYSNGGVVEDPEIQILRYGKANNDIFVDSKTNTKYMKLSTADIGGMETTSQYVQNTLGAVNYKYNNVFYNKLKNGKNLLAAPTGKVFYKYDAQGRPKQYQQVNLYTSTLEYDSDGNPKTRNTKYLQQAYMPIQYGDPTPNNSDTVSLFPSEETLSRMSAYESRVSGALGNGGVAKQTDVDFAINQ